MALGLYAATVPSFRQILGAMKGLLAKAPDDIVTRQLAPDMFPFTFQVKSTAVHSAGAIAAVRTGLFAPDIAPPPADLAGLRALIDAADAELAAVSPAEVDSFEGKPMRFQFRDHRMDFTAEDFLLSFSQPNFYFHAAMAYALLRNAGVPVGKRDFMGAVRVSAPA
ncbi:DUF1993 domain-containing protein [Thermaurantiacus sp.]